MKYCRDCLFLEVTAGYEEYWDCPEKHVHNAIIQHEQKNECLLMKNPTLRQKSSKGVYEKIIKEYYVNWLKDGTNPKKNKQCLDFTAYILKQKEA